MNTALAAPKEGLLRDQWRGRPYLLSPVLDFLLAGGGALIGVVLLALLIPYEKTSDDATVRAALFMGILTWAAYFVNYPHFMVSYQLFYHGYRKRLRSIKTFPAIWWRTLIAGIAVPALLFALMGYAVWSAAQGDTSWVGVSLQVMLFFVGWHYTKQAFGVFIMLSALKKIFYTPLQRKILVWNAYLVWLSSWAYMSYTSRFLGPAFRQAFLGAGNNPFGYDFIEIPVLIRFPLLIAAVATTLASIWALTAQWRATKQRPSVTALTGYLSMYYLWAFITVMHPEWALAAPLFHSLQYLLFVTAYKRGELHTKLREAPPEKHKRLRGRAQEFFGWAFVLGILAFNVIPYQIGRHYAESDPGMFPVGLFPLLALIFINVHHYFIDNVIWRKENKEVGAYLIGWRMAKG